MLKYTDYDIVFQEIPEEVTLAVNLSNCPHCCKGCHSPQLMQDIGQYLNEKTILELIEKYKNAITCVCFMGGDASPDEVEQLSILIKKSGLKTAWYSGCDDLHEKCKTQHFDYIKTGAYRQELGGLESPTTNQKLYKIENNTLIDISLSMRGTKKQHI